MFRTYLSIVVIIISACSNVDDTDIQDVSYIFHVSDDYERSNADRWLFFSDENGSVVYVTELVNGSTVEFKSKSNLKLTATIFTYVEISATSKNLFFKSYGYFYPDEYQLDQQYNGIADPTDKYINLTIQNVPSNQSAKLFGKGIKFGYPASTGNNEIQFETETSIDPSNFTCIAYGNQSTPLLYKKFSNIQANNPMLTFSYAEMVPMENKNEIKFENADNSSYALIGVDDNNTYWNLYGDSRNTGSDANTLLIYYTNTEFSQLITNLSFSSGNTFYGCDILDDKPAASFVKIKADITSFSGLDGAIKAEVSGVFDFFYSTFTNSEQVGNENTSYSWQVVLPGNSGFDPPLTKKIDFKIPAIPEEILKKYGKLKSMNANFHDPSIVDYSFTNVFDEYKEYIKIELADSKTYEKVKGRTIQIKSF